MHCTKKRKKREEIYFFLFFKLIKNTFQRELEKQEKRRMKTLDHRIGKK